MTDKKSLPLKSKLVKKPTQWLRDLPPGNYTVKELIEITGKVSSTIKQRLNLLEIPKIYDGSKTSFPLAVYIWKGIVEYERQNAKKKK